MDISLSARPPASWTRRPTPASASISIRLLNAFALEVSGQQVAVATGGQRLIAYLALQEVPLLRTHVAGSLWPDATDRRSMGNLRSTLWRLWARGLEVAKTVGDRVALSREVTVDLHVLRSLARRVLDRVDDLDVAQVEELAFGGDLLPDWSEDWVIVERESFRQLRLHAVERLGGQLAAAGRFGRAVEVCLAAIALEPLRESAHRQLIKVHLAEGNRVEALRQFEAYRRLMLDEVGLEPSSELSDLVGVPTVVLAPSSG
jgi:DNA-binding SARP family transcriptional activator